MSDRLRVRCTENVVLDGIGGRRLSFAPSLDVDTTVNGEFFRDTPGGEVQLVGVDEEIGEKYEVGKEYHIDIVLART
jgi:hypothetical protein